MTTTTTTTSTDSNARYMAYDGEGIEVGYLTLAEARAKYASAEIDTNDLGNETITVERE